MYLSIYLYGDTNLTTQKNSSRANDVMFMFVHVLPFDSCAILLASVEEAYCGLWRIVKLFILSSKSAFMAFKNFVDMPSRNVYDFLRQLIEDYNG